jgi:hypothetical protein
MIAASDIATPAQIASGWVPQAGSPNESGMPTAVYYRSRPSPGLSCVRTRSRARTRSCASTTAPSTAAGPAPRPRLRDPRQLAKHIDDVWQDATPVTDTLNETAAAAPARAAQTSCSTSSTTCGDQATETASARSPATVDARAEHSPSRTRGQSHRIRARGPLASTSNPNSPAGPRAEQPRLLTRTPPRRAGREALHTRARRAQPNLPATTPFAAPFPATHTDCIQAPTGTPKPSVLMLVFFLPWFQFLSNLQDYIPPIPSNLPTPPPSTHLSEFVVDPGRDEVRAGSTTNPHVCRHLRQTLSAPNRQPSRPSGAGQRAMVQPSLKLLYIGRELRRRAGRRTSA